MNTTIRSRALLAGGLLLALAAPACTEFLAVKNPTVIAADDIDPNADSPTFSLSARSTLANAISNIAVFASWLTWETWPGDTAPEYNEIARRAVPERSGQLGTLWTALSRALSSGETVVGILEPTPAGASSLDLARGYFVAAYALEIMAETFCDGVISGGPKLTTQQLLDSSVVRFTRAIDIGKAAAAASTGAAQTEANSIVNASYVGRARAHLQAGRKPQAAADAALVAAGFRYDLLFVDVLSARRLANQAFSLTRDRATIVVPPSFRTIDPRVPFVTPTAAQFGVDGITPFFAQAKFPSYATPLRLASKLEADYIAAEATGTVAMLALIATQRAANGRPAYNGATDAASVLAELMLQRSFEFYLESKRLGDFRRNGAAVPFVPPTGTPYFKAGFSPVGDQTCLPIPFIETSTNSNFPKA